MHPCIFPADFIRQVSRRTGKRHPFDEIEPQRTALLVVDMQNYFCSPDYIGEVPMAREIVPAINRLAGIARAQGAHVVWIKGSSDGSTETWSVFNTYLMTPERLCYRLETLAEWHNGHQLWPALDVRSNDGQIVKKRFSAFLQGSSNLDVYLRQRGIDTVLITGTTTDVCCDSTARDASMLNYKTIMVSDANATYSDESHLAALMAFYNVFGDVQTVDEVAASFERGK